MNLINNPINVVIKIQNYFSPYKPKLSRSTDRPYYPNPFTPFTTQKTRTQTRHKNENPFPKTYTTLIIPFFHFKQNKTKQNFHLLIKKKKKQNFHLNKLSNTEILQIPLKKEKKRKKERARFLKPRNRTKP